tara:strand:+ start:206 stop:445 length:240 start_codon:yes stop_codon:yes gene_type:complete
MVKTQFIRINRVLFKKLNKNKGSLLKIKTLKRISSCNKLSKKLCNKNKKCKMTKGTSTRNAACRPRKNRKISKYNTLKI